MTEVPPRVDAHHHLWDLQVRDQPWTTELPMLRRSFGVDELAPQLAAHNITATVVVQTVPVPDETPELLRLAADDRIVAGVVGWVDLTAADVADRIVELQDGPGGSALVGIRHQVQAEGDPRWLCRPDVRRGLAAVGATGLSYDLVITCAQLPAAVETAAALPELRFVLDHAGKPRIRTRELDPWQADIAQLARCSNTCVKLSGLVTEADHQSWTVSDLEPFADVLFDRFGADRVMFGSDWPVCLLAADYGRVIDAAEQLTAQLSADERAAVFGGTAATVYRLPT